MVASINSPGIGSGLDVKGIVDKLVAIERRPIDLLQQQQTGIQSRLSSFGLLKNYLSNLSDAATQLSDPPLWRTPKATSSDATKLSVIATDGGSASGGNYRVEVSQLAQGQTVASSAVADPKASLGSGTLHIELGRWPVDGSAFAPQADKPAVDISLAPGQDSLEAVRDRINGSKTGLSASIVTDATGSRLVLHSADTGENQGFRITVQAAADGNPASDGLSALAYDPANGTGGMRLTQAAQNAQLTVNGVEITSASNLIDGAIAGAKLNLLKAGGDAVSVTLASDSDAIQKAINGLVSSYNDLAKYIAGQTKYDAASKKGAPLQGDAATLQIQKALRKALADPTSASSVFPRLLDLGIKLGADNTLTVDNTKLQAALANPTELSRALSARGGDDVQGDGLALRFRKFAQTLLGTDGLVSTRNKALGEASKRNLDQQATLESRVTSVQARLLHQYTALDTKMSALMGQSNYVNQQMQMLLKQGS